MQYNIENGITPTTVQKGVRDVLETSKVAEEGPAYSFTQNLEQLNGNDLHALMQKLEKEMKEAARDLHFERAAELRDRLQELKKKL